MRSERQVAALLDAGLDLGALAGCFVAIALLTLVAYLLEHLSDPFRGIYLVGGYIADAIDSLTSPLLSGVQDALSALEKSAASFEQGLLQSLELLVGIPLVLADGLYVGLKALWTHYLAPFVNHVVADIRADVKGIEQDITSLYTLATTDLARAETYADKEISAASGALYAELRSEIHAAENAAEGYADKAVSALRAAEDAALSKAIAAANAGIAAAEAAAHTAETEAEAFTSGAVAKAEALANTAIADVRGIAVGAEDDIATLIGKYGLAGAAGLIASIPLLATLVNTIATESGLENADCRSKVKGICGTSTPAWENLLAGIAAIGVAFNLRDIVDAADAIFTDAADLIQAAA